MKFDRYVSLAYDLIDLPTTFNKHFSFIVLRNNIISIGFSKKKTNPKAKTLGYRFASIHSELDAIMKCPLRPNELQKCKMINVRVNTNNEICMSRPCLNCQALLSETTIKEVYYSTGEGFEKFV